MKGEYLTKAKQYEAVHHEGISWMDSFFIMKVLQNGGNSSRYGISVSKRVGKAVVRNRVKRLLREVLRLTTLEPGWDIIFIARPKVANVDYTNLESSVKSLLSGAHLLKSSAKFRPPIGLRVEMLGH